MHQLTLAQLSHALRDKTISSTEMTQHFIQRIEKYNPSLNCFISTYFEHALAQAKRADAQRAKGNAPALLGLPIAVKDIFCTENMKTTCASKMLADFTPPYNATAVQRMLDAGCIILGKTNMDEFAMGSSNENSYFGNCMNPWDVTRVPGGSSGGSASAVAARLIPLSLGTDTGGSIRQPAALCGITGIKPTYGRIPRHGMIAFASSLDQCGPLANTAYDCAMALQILSGHDPLDETSSQEAIPNFTEKLDAPLKGYRIGLPKQWFSEKLSSENSTILDHAIKELKQQGVIFKEIELPHADLALPIYYIIAPSECSSNLARYDGIHYGYRAKDPTSLEDLYIRSRSEGFGQEVKRRILVGTFTLSSGYYDAYYGKAQKIRQLLRQDFQNAFADVNAILGPTTPSTAFRIGEKNHNPVDMYMSDYYTIPANLAELPALSIPAGFSQGLPLGIQLIGARHDEATLLHIAHQYQIATKHHQQLPQDYV